MAAWYSLRAKAMLAHKFAAHIATEPLQERIFANNFPWDGHCSHHPPRYVYNRYSEKKFKAFHHILSKDSHPALNGGPVPDFDTWRQAFFDEKHRLMMECFARHTK